MIGQGTWWGWLVAILIDAIIGWWQREKANDLRSKFNKTDNDGRTLDDAIGNLRARAKPSGGLPKS